MSETKRSPKERAAHFVGALRQLRNDRGKLAALRHGLSGNSRLHVNAWPVIADLGGDINQPVYGAIASFFASHPNESSARNLGETCRCIALGDGKDLPESFERRFRRLLSCDELEDVIGQLRSWVRLASSGGVAMNYESLFADLWNWAYYSDEIRVKWARSFWLSSDRTADMPPSIVNPASL